MDKNDMKCAGNFSRAIHAFDSNENNKHFSKWMLEKNVWGKKNGKMLD